MTISDLVYTVPIYFVTLDARLRGFGFDGLNIDENKAKQEGDDYREVVKLSCTQEEYSWGLCVSRVSTCVGEDGSRYWVQVFGKDISSTKIADFRIMLGSNAHQEVVRMCL